MKQILLNVWNNIINDITRLTLFEKIFTIAFFIFIICFPYTTLLVQLINLHMYKTMMTLIVVPIIVFLILFNNGKNIEIINALNEILYKLGSFLYGTRNRGLLTNYGLYLTGAIMIGIQIYLQYNVNLIVAKIILLFIGWAMITIVSEFIMGKEWNIQNNETKNN